MSKSTISMAIFNSYVCFPEGTYSIWFRTWVVEIFIVIHITDHSNRSEFLTSLNKVQEKIAPLILLITLLSLAIINRYWQFITYWYMNIHLSSFIIVITMSGLQITPRSIWISGWGNLLQELKRAEQQLDRFMELGVSPDGMKFHGRIHGKIPKSMIFWGSSVVSETSTWMELATTNLRFCTMMGQVQMG